MLAVFRKSKTDERYAEITYKAKKMILVRFAIHRNLITCHLIFLLNDNQKTDLFQVGFLFSS